MPAKLRSILWNMLGPNGGQAWGIYRSCNQVNRAAPSGFAVWNQQVSMDLVAWAPPFVLPKLK